MNLLNLLNKSVYINEDFIKTIKEFYSPLMEIMYDKEQLNEETQTALFSLITELNKVYVDILKYSNKLSTYDYSTPWINKLEKTFPELYSEYTSKFLLLINEKNKEIQIDLIKELINICTNILSLYNDKILDTVKSLILMADTNYKSSEQDKQK